MAAVGLQRIVVACVLISAVFAEPVVKFPRRCAYSFSFISVRTFAIHMSRKHLSSARARHVAVDLPLLSGKVEAFHDGV